MLKLLRRRARGPLAATEWQAHSVRGFVTGTLRKRMGLKIESAKSTAGERPGMKKRKRWLSLRDPDLGVVFFSGFGSVAPVEPGSPLADTS
jgi:Protein of unknown function (DUF3489)